MSDMPRTPYLALDLDAFDRNAARLARCIVHDGGKHWRPHLKSIRSVELALRLQACGARGVTCATTAEAQAMVDGGIDDVLIASPLIQRDDLQVIAELNRHARVMAVIDDVAQLTPLAQCAAHAGSVVPLLIEVDVGLRRSGVASSAAAMALARAVREHPSLRLRGLMAWEGHASRAPAGAARRAAIEESIGMLADIARDFRAAALAAEVVSCGGTATYLITSALAAPTEIQAGGGVFGDLRAREDFAVPMEPALTLVASVLSRPSDTRIVCDAGWKSLAVYPVPPRLRGELPVAAMAHSAEHLTITLQRPSAEPAIGERLQFEIGYADATTFLHRSLHGCRFGEPDAQFELVAAHWAQAQRGLPAPLAPTGESKHGH